MQRIGGWTALHFVSPRRKCDCCYVASKLPLTLRKSLTSPFNQLIYNDPQCTALAIECPSVWTLGSRLTARTPDSANQVGENQWRILRRGTKNFRSAILFCQSSHTKGEVGAAVGSLSGT
jgi:hypothetical protein